MRIIFIKSAVSTGFAYTAGQTADLDTSVGQKFILSGLAIEITENKYSPIPEDFPFKHAFVANGYYSLEQLRKLPKDHGLERSNIYGAIPKTSKLLEDYENKGKAQKKPRKPIY